MVNRSHLFVMMPCIACAVACGGTIGNPGGSGPSGRGDQARGGDSHTPGGDTGDEPSGGDQFSGGDPVLGPTILIEGVTINQAVEIPIAANRAMVPTANRIAPVISLRGGLLRAYWSVENADAIGGGVAVVATLQLSSTVGGAEILSQQLTIDGPPDASRYDGVFTFELLADQVQPDSTLQVTFTRVGSGVIDTWPVTATPLEAWPEAMILDVVVLPTCGKILSTEEQDMLSAYLYNVYPINDLRLDFRPTSEPTWCSDYDATFTFLPQLRNDESSPPYRHYAALIGGDCGGWAYGVDETSVDAIRTLSLCDWRDYGPTADLFAHELAHTHGRQHSFEDAGYPNANTGNCGARITYGYGPMSGRMPMCHYSNDVAIGYDWVSMQQLIPPTEPSDCTTHFDSWSDITSYNYPYWVSAYTYAALAENIRLTSSWISGGIPGPPGPVPRPLTTEHSTYVGLFIDDRVLWSRSRGHARVGLDAAPDQVAVLTSDGPRAADAYWIQSVRDVRDGIERHPLLVVHVTGEDISAIVVDGQTHGVDHLE